jgi:hypothetical protein
MIKQIAAIPAKILAMLEVEAETAAGLSDEVKAQIAALDREALGEETYKKKVEELAGNPFQNLAQSEIDGLMSQVKQLQEVVEKMLDVIDAPNFESIDWPDLRGEIGIDKLFQKYPIFLQVEMIQLITKILPIDINVTVPPLGIKIDIVKFVTDKDYKAKLVAELTGNGPDIKALLSKLDPTALGLEAYESAVNKIKNNTDLSAEEIKAQIAALPSAEEMATEAYMDKVNELKGGIIDPLYKLLPPEWQSFGGEEGFEIPELKGQALIAYIESKMSGLGVGLLFDAFAGLISKFDVIWDALGLPALPIPLSLDVGAMITAVVDAEKAKFAAEIESLESMAKSGNLEGLSEDVKAEIAALDPKALGEEAYNEKVNELSGMTLGDAKIKAFDKMSGAMIQGLEGLSIAGFSIMSIIGGPIEDPVECLALKKKRICEEIGRFKDNWQFYLLRKWMELVTSFFDAIGLGTLTKYISMDFCTFLGILGFPTSIDLSFSDHITEVKNTAETALPVI